MKYYVIQSSNGTVVIVSEWSDLESAKKAFADRWKLLLNDAETITGYVAILDSDLNIAGGYKEFIDHRPEPEQNEE
jgi:hypothetical protein